MSAALHELPVTRLIVGIFEFAAEGDQTRRTARARHRGETPRETHAAPGFDQSWDTTVAEQPEAVAKRLAEPGDA